MLEIIALISVAAWFVKTANANGLNPVGWAVAALVAYFGAEFGVIFAVGDHVAALFMASPTDSSGALLATISASALGIAAGILACWGVAQLLESRAAAARR